MKIFSTDIICVTVFLTLFGCESTNSVVDSYPSVISGVVKNSSGVNLSKAKVSLTTAPEVNPVYTTSDGAFYFSGLPQIQHSVKVEKFGYETYTANVPNPVNGRSTINPVLLTKTFVIPDEKPLSTGPVRINGKKLEVDFDGDGLYLNFTVKGTAFSPVPIGNAPITTMVYDRSIEWLKNLNANTVRTYSGVDKHFLRKAAENGIRVIVSFWVGLDLDLSLTDVRSDIVENFAAMVLDLKDYPGVLMWNIGNEQNYSSTPNNGNSPYWYSLVQEMAVAAYKAEGSSFHPVCISNGNLHNIGSSAMQANDTSLTYVDLWASNAYEKDFAPFFSTYRSKTIKPIVITEFGIDALNHVTKTEHEAVQAYFDSTNWVQIRAADDVCVGGTVFEFTDEWWKDVDPLSHDYGGYPTGAHPDGYSNEEWWGIVAVTPDADGDGLDEWRARTAFEMFRRNWQ